MPGFPLVLRPAAAAVLGLSALGAAAGEGWIDQTRAELRTILREGRPDLHLSGLYWHLPFAYPAERRQQLNDAAWGLGWGRSLADGRGNERSLLAQVSRSSHHQAQYVVGYVWMARWPLVGGLRLGAGYSAFVFARSDIYHYLPLPGAVPMASLGTDRVTLYVAYLPRIHNAITGTGNVLYAYLRIRI